MREIEWVNISYSVIPKRLFDKYNVKPFSIMKKKMRNSDGEVWSNISFFDARKEAEKLGYRLFGIKEALVLFEAYRERNEEVSYHDKDFLGIEELAYDEKVCLEWLEINEKMAFLRGGCWAAGAHAGAFALYLSYAPSDSGAGIGFRCVEDIENKK